MQNKNDKKKMGEFLYEQISDMILDELPVDRKPTKGTGTKGKKRKTNLLSAKYLKRTCGLLLFNESNISAISIANIVQ